MAIPKFHETMMPILKVLRDRELHPRKDLISAVVDQFQLTEEERTRALPTQRGPVVKYRTAWGLTYLRQAGLIETERRGVYRITARGVETLRDEPAPLDVKYLTRFPEFVEFQSRQRGGRRTAKTETENEAPDPDQTPEEALDTAYQSLRSNVEAELLETVTQATPAFFESLVVDLLVRMGYGGSRKDAGSAVGRSGDEGIDGIIKEDRLGLDAIYIQAKRWANTVGRPEIQKFAGALQGHRAKKGVFITTSDFSSDARRYAGKIDSRIVLIDGKELAHLMYEHNAGVTTVDQYEIKRVDSDYFGED